MPLQHKHSRTADAVPNLVPGEIAINWQDETFWLRADGKKVPVNIQKWEKYAAPSLEGADGAPLRKTDDSYEWASELAPSSVVDGRIIVDPSAPASVYGIPGVMVTGVSGSRTLPSEQAVSEYFYVASDRIQIDRTAVNVLDASGGLARVVIADMSDTILTTGSINNLTQGMVNTANVFIELTRGWYKIIFWSEQGCELAQIAGAAFEQGFNLDGNGEKLFKDHDYVTVDWTSAPFLSGIGWFERTSYVPGIRRLIAMHWNIPA